MDEVLLQLEVGSIFPVPGTLDYRLRVVRVICLWQRHQPAAAACGRRRRPVTVTVSRCLRVAHSVSCTGVTVGRLRFRFLSPQPMSEQDHRSRWRCCLFFFEFSLQWCRVGIPCVFLAPSHGIQRQCSRCSADRIRSSRERARKAPAMGGEIVRSRRLDGSHAELMRICCPADPRPWMRWRTKMRL